MSESRFVAQRLMRCGYTTGSCAAAAAKAATMMMLCQSAVCEASILTPNGRQLTLQVLEASFHDDTASCAVRKDSGDDPDITDGALIYATVARIPSGILIDGGEGVGRVTKAGLDQPVGNAAINTVPRRMIFDEVAHVCGQNGYMGGISVVISVPSGEELAARTFNPRLGIVGGISILGTSGIVEPMSNSALIGAIRAELRVLAASGEKKLLITIGNYGGQFVSEILCLPLEYHVKCGNFIGETLAAASELGFDNIFIVGHIGKLVKLGIGLINTHSAYGDGRRETLIACALRAGAPIETLRGLDACATTEAAIGLLRKSVFLPRTMEILGKLIEDTLKRQVLDKTRVGFVCFLDKEILTQSGNAQAVMESWRNEE